MSELNEFKPGRYAQLVEAGRTDPSARQTAALYRARYANRVAREERVADHTAQVERAAQLAVYQPYLPSTPDLDEYERLAAESPTLGSIHYRNAGRSRKIEAQREARDAKIAELDALVAEMRGDKPEAPSDLEAFREQLNAKLNGGPDQGTRGGQAPFTMPGNAPEQPQTITRRGETLNVVPILQTPRPDGTPPDKPPSAPLAA